MGVEEIKKIVAETNWADETHDPTGERVRLILAWAHSEAIGTKYKFWLGWLSDGKQGPSPSMFIDDYVDGVLDSIGWPKDKR